MKAHFFIADSGELFDTRDSDWSAHPLRANYRKHHRAIDSVADFKACLRAGKTTDLGGYPLYFLDNEGNAISFDAAHKSFAIYAREIEQKERGRITHCDINYEDSALFCADSGEQIPSAYGDEESD